MIRGLAHAVWRSIFYLPGDWPEMSALDSPAERHAARLHVWGRLARSPLYWLLAGALIVLTALLIVLGKYWIDTSLLISRSRSSVLPYAAFAVYLAILLAFVAQLGLWPMRRMVRSTLRAHLASQGVHLCARCNYDLRGLADRRCPECGALSESQPRASVPRSPQ